MEIVCKIFIYLVVCGILVYILLQFDRLLYKESIETIVETRICRLRIKKADKILLLHKVKEQSLDNDKILKLEKEIEDIDIQLNDLYKYRKKD